jgi:hypothetical protein
MLKNIIVAGTTAAVIAGAGLAWAQPSPSRDEPRWRPNAEDRAAFTDARLAGLKAGLKLTAEQEKHWPAFEAAMRDLAKQRADRMNGMAERMAARREARRSDNAPPAPDAIGRLRQGADALTTQAGALKKLADAADPLYKSLDDGQKRRLAMLTRGMRPGGGHHWRGHDRGEGRGDRGR